MRLDHIDITNLAPRLKKIKVDVACNWHNVLCGPQGVARVFGPQKGASPETVEQLEIALENYAAIILREFNIDVRFMPGGGASGGLGTGLHVFLNATLHPWYDIVMQYVDIDGFLQETDLIITAEGSLDFQTSLGKIPVEVARGAKRYGLPVVALTGTIGENAQSNFKHGIDSFLSILEAPCTLSEAIQNTPDLLLRAAERMMRLILVGQKIKVNEIIEECKDK